MTLNQQLNGFPKFAALCDVVIAHWPEHERFLATSVASCSADITETSDRVADIILRIAGDQLPAYVAHMASHTTHGVTLARAAKQKAAVTCSIIAEPA